MQPVPEQFTKAPEIHGEERRLRIRRSPAGLTYVTLGENNGGILANVSETGMSVTAGEPLRENVLSHVSFKLAQSDRLIESRAEVVWTSESKKEAGLRFVDMREETREQIRNWISPPRRNGRKVEPPAESTSESESRLTAAATADNPPSVKPAEKSNGHAADVASRDEPKQAVPAASPTRSFATEDKTTTGPTESSRLSEAVLLQRLAASGSGPKSWAFTAAQRAEFERLFPSEIRGHEAREPAAPELAAQSEPIVEHAPASAPSFAPPIADTGQEPVAAAAYEQRAAPSASAQRPADVAPEAADPARMWRAAPAMASPRMPAPSLWDAPPPMLQPIIGGGFGSSYGAQAADSADESRPRNFWSIAALSILIVVACFALGFAEGPDLVGHWPLMEDVRQIVHNKLNHVKAAVTNRGSTQPTVSSDAPWVTSNTATNEQAARPAQPVVPAPATPAPTVPNTTAPSAGNAAPDANAAPNVAVPGNPPSGDSASSNSASSEKAGKSNEVNATATPSVSESAPAAAKERRSEPSVSAPRTPESRASASPTPPKETPVETPYTPPVMKTAPTAGVSTPREVSPPATASTHAAESSAPLGSSSMPSSSTPNSSLPSSSPAKTPSAPPGRAAAPAAHPATSPPSYFPVVAPAAGNVPRLIELPEEKVIDTAAVVIHSHQIVFVPAEPGPESSHKLEKLRIGDRTTKLAPAYPAQAAQKAMGGTVHLRAIIGKDGNVQDVRPINGPISLIPAAVEAIRQWQYRPTLLDQQPIEMQEDFTIEFRPLGVQVRQ
jgi:TonB family protein